MFIKCHYSTGGAEAVEGKQKLEQFAAGHGIRIKAYRADNGIMAKREYLTNIELNNQTITLSGVNHHSQNGIAERNIRTITDRARTMLLHAVEKWLEAITMDMWPFALKMVVDIHNATPGKSGSPKEIFTRQKARQDRLVDFHTFGCPVFVLDPTLQQGHKLPKRQPRSRQAVYLGHSPQHAQTVPVVFNLHTRLCSPQYHVVFDNHFTMMTASATNTLPANWDELFTNCRIDCFEGEDIATPRPPLALEWTDQTVTVVESQTPEGDRHHNLEISVSEEDRQIIPVSEGAQHVQHPRSPPAPVSPTSNPGTLTTSIEGTPMSDSGHLPTSDPGTLTTQNMLDEDTSESNGYSNWQTSLPNH
jgi:hypothetical protein